MDEGPDASNLGEEDGIAVVSSQHLVPPQLPAWAQFEYGLILAWHAFARWMVRCMAAAGEKDMTAMDVSLLHHVNHRGRKKKLADICFVLNIEDTHVVSYALKKLLRAGYVANEKVGKEVLFFTTPAGMMLCERYREVRERCLIGALVESGTANADIGDTAQLLRVLSGLYDQAARAGASL